MIRATAPKITEGNLSSTLVVEGGASITVYAIRIGSEVNTNESITLTDANDNTIGILPVDTTAFPQNQAHFAWLADKGLKLTASGSGASIHVTVYHSQPGS